ncbi:hypothetical protein NQZ68_032956 [Dissostichus eleginoides]|nr:hypothetical protein NQZ68_032956 [Dissostichus eleginoides]
MAGLPLHAISMGEEEESPEYPQLEQLRQGLSFGQFLLAVESLYPGSPFYLGCNCHICCERKM